MEKLNYAELIGYDYKTQSRIEKLWESTKLQLVLYILNLEDSQKKVSTKK